MNLGFFQIDIIHPNSKIFYGYTKSSKFFFIGLTLFMYLDLTVAEEGLINLAFLTGLKF